MKYESRGFFYAHAQEVLDLGHIIFYFRNHFSSRRVIFT
ncbi:hypothetical protein KIS4809_5701 [Bacillus sp. ZZV12-4809]|nr:hypothetical protein KIS4809_5701 [Bacillus sp. ZZV12-4809]